MKRLGYFTIFIVCILLLLQNAGAHTLMNNSVIGIQYVGPSDQPVTPIVIAQSREDADLLKKVILKLSDLEMTNVHVALITLGLDFGTQASSFGAPSTVVGTLENIALTAASKGISLGEARYKSSFDSSVSMTDQYYLQALQAH